MTSSFKVQKIRICITISMTPIGVVVIKMINMGLIDRLKKQRKLLSIQII